MEDGKKDKKVLIAVIVILGVCIIGLVLYLFLSKDIGKSDNTVENGQIEENNTENTEGQNSNQQENVQNLGTNDANVITLFDKAHYLTIAGVDTHIYRDGGYKVSEMSEDEKILLVASQWSPLVEVSSYGNQSLYFLYEDTLKNIYEGTFGPNTYNHVNQITDGCLTLTYDSADSRFSYAGISGCGGTSTFSVFEKIISATRYSDRIEIVSAAVYLDGMDNQMYKDYNKTTSLGELLVDENIVTNKTERENTYNQYIENNKDNLEQYTYTFTRNDDNFYYLTSVERTKS